MGNNKGPDADDDNPTTPDINGCMQMAMFQEEGAATYHGSAISRRAAEEGPLLVPCLRSGEDNLATAGVAGFSMTAGGGELHHQQIIRQDNTSNDDADTFAEVFPATNCERAVAGGGEKQSNHSDEQGRLRSETPPNGPGNRTEGQERRRAGMVAASVRAGDWILPTRCVDDFAGRGGGASLPRGKKVGWLRVEAVSVRCVFFVCPPPLPGSIRTESVLLYSFFAKTVKFTQCRRKLTQNKYHRGKLLTLCGCSPTPPPCLIRASPTFFPASRHLYHPWRSREECIILATRGTGGNRRPELRASPKLLELSPVLLPGALVVRQALPLDGSTGWDCGDRATGVGVGQTEAFRLPGKKNTENMK